MGNLNIPCNGLCEKCKYEDCILTEEQALKLDILEHGVDYDREKQVTKHYRKSDKEYQKKYYQEHKEEIKARVKKHRQANREHYNLYERQHPRKRDRSEYYKAWYLKKKGERNANKENVSIGIADSNNDNIIST